MRPTIYQAWQHEPSGETYVVGIKGSEIVEASAELHHSEIEQALTGDFDTDPEQLEWVQENQNDFQPKE